MASLNEKRRELIQTLLIVGGIIGGFSATLQHAAFVLQFLVFFIIFATFIYAWLLSDTDIHGITYTSSASVSASGFSLMLFFVVADAIRNEFQAYLTLIGGVIIITISLIGELNIGADSTSKPLRANEKQSRFKI